MRLLRNPSVVLVLVKTMIQFFVVVTVALGIASVLIVSVVQKSREIGILRAVGTPPRRILAIFLIQGGVLGLAGSFVGAALGVFFAKAFETVTSTADGLPRYPVQVDLSARAPCSILSACSTVRRRVASSGPDRTRPLWTNTR